MKNYLFLLVGMLCFGNATFGQSVLTLDELDALATKNSKAIQVLDQNVQTLTAEVDELKRIVQDREPEPSRLAATVGRDLDYKMPEPLAREKATTGYGGLGNIADGLEKRLDALESKVRVVPSGLEDFGLETFGVSSFTPTSVRTVAVGNPVITSVGAPRVTSYSMPTSSYGNLFSSGACNDPNCTNPNCPNRVNFGYNSFTSSNPTYTSVSSNRVNARPVRGQMICNNGVCYRVK